MSKIIVLSVDAMVYDDIEYFKTLPNFKYIYDNGSIINTIKTIYPTITYAAHTSMSTGAYPNKHGVISNSHFIPGTLSAPWRWFSDARKCPDIFTAAKSAGLKTAAIFWPVTGNHPDVDYLVAEYWPQTPEETNKEAFLRAGTKPEVYAECVEPFIKGVKIRTHPATDKFMIDCACQMIKSYQPDLLMIHPGNVDSYRHKTGVFSPLVTRGIEETDVWIGDLIQATKDAGVFEETNFFIISDHGQMDVVRAVKPNVILADKGLITYDEDGNLIDWRAYCNSTGMSSHVYLKDPTDEKTKAEVYQILSEMRDEGIYGIGEIYTTEEINEREHLSGDFTFVLETDGYSSFSDGWTRPYVKKLDLSDYRFGKATHGYLPDKGAQPTFIACGPDIKQGVVLERRPIVDEAPTYAKILGITMPWADGTPIDEILNNG